jgi:hypothetical protein
MHRTVRTVRGLGRVIKLLLEKKIGSANRFLWQDPERPGFSRAVRLGRTPSLSAEGWSDGVAGATELPSVMLPRLYGNHQGCIRG